MEVDERRRAGLESRREGSLSNGGSKFSVMFLSSFCFLENGVVFCWWDLWKLWYTEQVAPSSLLLSIIQTITNEPNVWKSEVR
jgi:hypothetical protein